MYFLRSVWQGVKLFCSAVPQHVRYGWLGQLVTMKPEMVELLANDICDARCVMCNIWLRTQSEEITLLELQRILADPLFGEIQQVEITGGEPTLRADLPEIGEALIGSLPKLRTLRLSTNALNPQQVIERTGALARVAETAGIQLRVCISLDGVGDDHDRNRGVEGSFISAAKVIKDLKRCGIPVSVVCTLTALNVHAADDVLLWCEENAIRKWAFRIGVDAKRYYNEGYGHRHGFTPEQRFHAVMFFDKLSRHRGASLVDRMFYKSLVGQLALGMPRRVGCGWQTQAMTLDMHGGIGFCPAQSLAVGSALAKSASQVFKEGIPHRRAIVNEYCGSCQYDLPGPPMPGDLVSRGFAVLRAQWQDRRGRVSRGSIPGKSVQPAEVDSPRRWRHVLITGWYGTETAGDKAILGELLHFLKSCAPDCRVSLTSLDKKVSQQTERELVGLVGSNLVEMGKAHSPALIESVDAVIMGGGPLMETSAMEHVWRMFVEANRQRKARIVFGCGVGPLHSDRMRQIAGAVLRMSTAGFLRDRESFEGAATLAPGNPLSYACDPALAYLRRWVANHRAEGTSGKSPLRIAGLLRANTNEFTVDVPTPELGDSNAKAAQQIAQILETFCRRHEAQADLLHMNAHWIGGDDRIFNRLVAGDFSGPEYVRVERRYLPLENLLHSLQDSDAAVAMRYHGHLFCMALGIPFLSIDYTGKSGKVRSLIERIGYEEWCEDWRSIDPTRAADRFERLLERRRHWAAYLQHQADRLVTELHHVYARVFNVQEMHE